MSRAPSRTSSRADDMVWELTKSYLSSWAAEGVPVSEAHRRLVAEGLVGDALTRAMQFYRDEAASRR